ncbi:GDP-fucose O-fucosyltransferase 2 [Gossypium australe]|uniref:O-fucosyltransferase family protein n=1 Tax=Gossypium australe TaxID=47621 RepID=A0A5B6WAD0_9ROSI|nr:GDP-fucose O-fucosyltransferase 2 [Gossypium australe]
MDRHSSDEDDDRQTLIHQNDTKHRPRQIPTSPRASTAPRSGFHIEELESQIRRRFKLTFNKRYLFAIFLPLLLIPIFLSTGIRSLFSSNISSLKFNKVSDQLKESQLQALYLLNQQLTSLLSLWNHTFVNSNDNVSAVQFDDIKASLLNQITLNKHIQQTLLSPHKTGNTLQNATVLDPAYAGYSFDRCRKVDLKFSERRTIKWKPKPNKFLFAICLSGQMSNHLICLEKHMFFAAVLNRALVIPSSKFDYQYNRVLDTEHINDCVGKKAVIPFEDFMEMKKNQAHIDRFICYFSSPQPCYVDEEHLKKLRSLGISMGKLESAWKNEDIKKPSQKTIKDLEEKFASDDDVIAIGDVFFAEMERDWVTQPGGPIAHKCKTLIEPSKLILLTAQRFIQTFLGSNFIALHFRRHGFLKFWYLLHFVIPILPERALLNKWVLAIAILVKAWVSLYGLMLLRAGNAKKPSCFYPIPQAADCITRMVERANTPIIYLSTDAAESETGLLQSMIVLNGKTIPLVKRPPRNSAEKWDALLYRHGIEDDPQVEAMLDKTICAMASVFIGAPGSTFTEDILRLRKDWGTASLCDEYLCQGEGPNFIAGEE